MYTPPTPTRRDKTVSSRRRRRCVLGITVALVIHRADLDSLEVVTAILSSLDHAVSTSPRAAQPGSAVLNLLFWINKLRCVPITSSIALSEQ